MKNNDMRNYLWRILEAEKNVYTLSELANNLNYRIQNFGNHKDIREEKIPKTAYQGKDFARSFTLIGLLFGVAIAIFDAFMSVVVGSREGFLEILGLIFRLFLYMGIAPILGTLFGAGFRKSKEIIHKIKDNKNRHVKFNNLIVQDNNRVQNELIMKENATQYLPVVNKQINATKHVLSKLYGLNIVHPTYRNLIAIASLYQYVDTGRCTQLEGHEGAYNLYESERRQNMIITQLNAVITQLEQIKYNQAMLYNAICVANDKINKLTKISELSLSYNQATARNSEIIAYNTQVTAQNTEFLKWVEILR